MPLALIPAQLEFAADGTPWSRQFDDVYHSAAGGAQQARHVFLAGNRLPQRWAGRERFVILESGFGFGLNFLATWQAWRRDPPLREASFRLGGEASVHAFRSQGRAFPLSRIRSRSGAAALGLADAGPGRASP